MKAILSQVVGGPSTLVYTDAPDPTPRAGEVLVKVHACGVNYPDSLIIEDRYQFKAQRPFSPDTEASTIGDP